jgi:(hydroxyamino)benzene mutase
MPPLLQLTTVEHSMNRASHSREPAGEQMRQGHRLIQVGLSLFLIALLTGLVVHKLPLPRLALSAHLLGIMQGTFLAVVGLLWPRLTLGRFSSKITFVLVVYGCLAAWLANLLGAMWAAGGAMVPFAAGDARGSTLQEVLIRVGLRTAAVSLILALLFLLWGMRLRVTNGPDPDSQSPV